MNRKKLLGKALMFGVAPLVVMAILTSIVGFEQANRAMMYLGPLLLAPLILKYVVKRRQRSRSTDGVGTS